MIICRYLTLLPALLLFGNSLAYAADNYEFKVHKKAGSGACPVSFSFSITTTPIDTGTRHFGIGDLQAFAEPFEFGPSNTLDVTWIAKLKGAFKTCKATGWLASINDNERVGSNVYTSEFDNGEIRFKLDLSPLGNYGTITNQIVKKGNVSFTWVYLE